MAIVSNKRLEFSKEENNSYSTAKLFFQNGLGIYVIDWESEYEVIPVIGSESNNKPAEEFDEYGNLYTCSIKKDEHGIENLMNRISQIENYSF